MDLFTLNWLLGLGTLLSHGVIVGLIVLYVMRDEKLEKLILQWALPLSFLITTFGVVLSLVYSEYFGIVPCGLCWLTRIFLYPQAIMFAIASWKKDAGIALYSLAFSIPGILVGFYHHYLQMGGGSVLPCPASGESDCAKRFLFEFGYITFPLIGATSFILIAILMAFVLRTLREQRT